MQIRDNWQTSGPELPIEFSRISSTRSRALTLVIDPINGTNVRTMYAVSQRTEIDESICDLRGREGTTLKNIGFVNLRNGESRSNAFPEACQIIRDWTIAACFDATVWTDLKSNFEEKSNIGEFNIENAVEHFKNLKGEGRKKAEVYFQKTSVEVMTSLREKLIEEGLIATANK